MISIPSQKAEAEVEAVRNDIKTEIVGYTRIAEDVKDVTFIYSEDNDDDEDDLYEYDEDEDD